MCVSVCVSTDAKHAVLDNVVIRSHRSTDCVQCLSVSLSVCLSVSLSVSAMHGSAWLSVTLIDGRTLAACRRDVMVLRAVPLQMTVTHSLVLN